MIYTDQNYKRNTFVFAPIFHELNSVYYVHKRHTGAIIMLSHQHLDMPHMWGGWIIKGEVLTNTDLDRFVNNIWEK